MLFSLKNKKVKLICQPKFLEALNKRISLLLHFKNKEKYRRHLSKS